MREVLEPLVDRLPVEHFFVGVVITAVVLDTLAIRTGTLFPISLRRQANKSLEFVIRRSWVVALIWGLDAGFSVGTYRVTSGLWIGCAGVVFGVLPPWVVIAYAGTLALALLGLSAVRQRRPASSETPSGLQTRVMRMAIRRRAVQVAYATAVTAALLGSVGGA